MKLILTWLTSIFICNIASSTSLEESTLFRVYTGVAKSFLQNNRIILRTFDSSKDNIEDLANLLNEPEISYEFKLKWWQNSLEGCADFFSRGAFEGDGAVSGKAIRLPLLIEDKTTGKIVGNFNMNQYGNFIEISYNIFPAYRRQGFALEAIHAATKAIQYVDPFIQIGAWTEPKNTASRRLLIKAGLTYQFTDHRPLCAYLLEP